MQDLLTYHTQRNMAMICKQREWKTRATPARIRRLRDAKNVGLLAQAGLPGQAGAPTFRFGNRVFRVRELAHAFAAPAETPQATAPRHCRSRKAVRGTAGTFYPGLVCVQSNGWELRFQPQKRLRAALRTNSGQAALQNVGAATLETHSPPDYRKTLGKGPFSSPCQILLTDISTKTRL